MNNLREIAEKLHTAKNILLYPHVGIDADAVGSCVAIAKALRVMGKNAYALYAEGLPENLNFMLYGEDGRPYFTDDSDIIPDEDLDISIAVDCGSYERFRPFEDKFKAAKTTLCIDHHGTSIMIDEKGAEHSIADFSAVDPGAAACGILVFELLKEMQAMTDVGLIPDREIGEALFAAITTDTGNFQYSNTNRKCFEVMAELTDWGIDINKVSVEIYQNVRVEEIKIRNRAMEHIRMVSGGLGAVTYVTGDDLEEIGVREGETDTIVEIMRSIRGVEVVAFIKEKDHNVIRVSYRSKSTADVSVMAVAHNGGGHRKAAGCTLYMPVMDAVGLITKEIEEFLDKAEI